MPAWHWLTVSLPLEEFVTSRHLGIARILDFVPGGNGMIGEIGRGRLLRDDSFEVHFADPVKERDA